MAAIVVAAGTSAIGTMTACFAIGAFGVILIVTLVIAAIYALRK